MRKLVTNMRKLVIEHNVLSPQGERFPIAIIDAAEFGSDFDLFEGETHFHDDGMHGNIHVTFSQTFLTTDLSDEELKQQFQ